MTDHPIACPGAHDPGTAPVLGSLELPDDAHPEQIAVALAGVLCAACTALYDAAVADDGHPIGIPPRKPDQPPAGAGPRSNPKG